MAPCRVQAPALGGEHPRVGDDARNKGSGRQCPGDRSGIGEGRGRKGEEVVDYWVCVVGLGLGMTRGPWRLPGPPIPPGSPWPSLLV